MANPAFQALAHLASVSRSSAKGLPAQADVSPRWSGVGFSCLGHRFVVPMGQISELMEVPSTTKLPGVQAWVLGLSNVRGRLLPLLDLARYMGGQIGSQRKAQRVLVLEMEGLFSGLVVDRAFGMQHFIADTFEDFNGELPERLGQYVKGTYRDSSGEPWCVFDMMALAEDPNFINAAVT